MAGNSPFHFGRSAGANLPLNSSLRAIALSCHTSARTGGGAGLACCKVGLDRPLIPAAFVANLFVRRGSPDYCREHLRDREESLGNRESRNGTQEQKRGRG